MTREEEIKEASAKWWKDCGQQVVGMVDEYEFFEDGARWADEHPESSWRSVSDCPPPKDVRIILHFTPDYGCGITEGIWSSGNNFVYAAFGDSSEKDLISMFDYWMPIAPLPKRKEVQDEQ